MKIAEIIGAFAAGFFIAKVAGGMSDDEAAQEIVKLYKWKVNADAANDPVASAELLQRYNDMRTKYPNAPLSKYM